MNLISASPSIFYFSLYLSLSFFISLYSENIHVSLNLLVISLSDLELLVELIVRLKDSVFFA